MSEQQQELIKIDALRGRSLDTMSEQELRALNAYRLRLRRRNKEYALMAAKKLAEHKALMEELESLTEENRHLLHLGPRGVDVQNKMAEWLKNIPKEIERLEEMLRHENVPEKIEHLKQALDNLKRVEYLNPKQTLARIPMVWDQIQPNLEILREQLSTSWQIPQGRLAEIEGMIAAVLQTPDLQPLDEEDEKSDEAEKKTGTNKHGNNEQMDGDDE